MFDWDSHLKRSSGGEYPGFPSLRWILCRKLKRLNQILCKGPMNGLQRKTARNNKMRSRIVRKDCSRVAKTRSQDIFTLACLYAWHPLTALIGRGSAKSFWG